MKTKLVKNPLRKQSLGPLKRRWENDTEIGCEDCRLLCRIFGVCFPTPGSVSAHP
jgi:hypothetical protein